jgi:hypothetical protein
MNDEPSKDATKEAPGDERPLTFWQIAGSAAAAAFGVQSRANRERDFSRGKPLHFIIAGITFTALFVLIVVSVVRFILHSAAS